MNVELKFVPPKPKPEIEKITLTMNEEEARTLFKILGESHSIGSYVFYQQVGKVLDAYDDDEDE